MTDHDTSENLVSRAKSGEKLAMEELLTLNRSRLKKMVVHRMDSRLASRFDPSDVVQDAIALAYKSFDQFAESTDQPFYPWLRKIAVNRLTDLQREHLQSQKRSVAREVQMVGNLSETGQQQLAAKLVAVGASPSEKMVALERKNQMHDALSRLRPIDREVLALRFLEGLATPEAAHILEVAENTFAQRLVRALKRFGELLREEDLS